MKKISLTNSSTYSPAAVSRYVTFNVQPNKPSKQIRYFFISFLFAFISLVSDDAIAQLTTCTGCSSSDIKVKRVYLADANGNPLSSSCTPGTPVSAQICVDFDVTAQTRYGFYFGFEYKIGSTTYSQSQCYAQAFSQGPFTLCYPITYNCGQSVSLLSTLLGWGNQVQDLNTFCNPSNLTCQSLNPKCYTSTNLPAVEAPLISDFTSTTACQTGQSVQTVTFNGTATGGTPAYTYSWDLDGNGTFETTGQNPTFTYQAAGIYAVSLKVTDSNSAGAVSDVQTYSVTVSTCTIPALPVLYTYFRAQSVGEGIQLEWETSLEVNHDHFEVELSTNAIDFKRLSDPISTPLITAGNKKAYRYTDTKAHTGPVYYRIKQVDVSGQANFSKILSIVFSDTTSLLELSPNPVRDQLNLRIQSTQNGEADIEIIDLMGKRWSKSSILKIEQTHQHTINTQSLPVGQYVVSIRIGDQYFVRRIVK
ncbi:T9SS type A sorting domain-containing protein [Spirosoma sp.]|uniref:T9SS type A sorting domain-containing protein n=1 Tax=Spirosoma sp. TaxID=1899569 RepID=UPI003B3A6FAA